MGDGVMKGYRWVMTQAVEALLPPFAERGAGGIARTGGMNETGREWYWRLAIAGMSLLGTSLFPCHAILKKNVSSLASFRPTGFV